MNAIFIIHLIGFGIVAANTNWIGIFGLFLIIISQYCLDTMRVEEIKKSIKILEGK